MMSASQSVPAGYRLTARNVSHAFGGVAALQQTSLVVEPGRITGIVGPNGAGKTTLFNILAGALTPDAGQVCWGERDITRLAIHRRAALGISRTFQLSRELDSLTLLENLLLAAPRQPGDALWRIFLTPKDARRAEQAAIDKALALLERVHLRALRNEPAGSLSGGQKKLLELCRALMSDPAVILLDEPAAGVNPATIDELVAFILALRAQGKTFAVVEHNMALMAALCDTVYVLAEGRVLTQGSFETIAADRRVQQAYLGM
ncbi:ABC transporter ATP-binding protein [Brenneria corticis]|uniref:ABC transporter ATP-binding protein n=1 Tax=Brenneria corticis TaxID=2173106 RepID=A0A2U1TT82_9GAMM|nr:ABC transporter ATP-binding protein [Brenneria sp. CFCC 11842]PWC12613.1 ABC transporter ATP-binding protein [Brenneria sp. CFCC 11842]